MNIRLAALAALLLLTQGQALAEDVHVDCVTDQRIICRDDEATCRPPVQSSGKYHFKIDLTKKTGSLIFCSDGCMEPSPVTIVRDHCAFLGEYGSGCLGGNVFLWEPIQETTYAVTNSRYVATLSGIADHSLSITEFGHCAVR